LFAKLILAREADFSRRTNQTVSQYGKVVPADIGAGVPKPERQGAAYMQKFVVSEVDRWRKILVDVKVGQ
jgi:hypothetical protein